MRVLVTGATGFVGERVARQLRTRGDGVLAPVRTESDALTRAGVEQVAGGLDALSPGLLGDVDAAVHLAATAGPDLATARQVNRDGTARLVDACLEAGVARLVHVSTTAVYDHDAIGDAEVDEAAPLVHERPDGDDRPAPYPLTKAEAELEVARGVRAGLSAAILRPPAVLGTGPTSTWGTRVPRRIRDGEPVPLHPAATFAWVHVDDLVDAVLAALDLATVTTVHVVGGHTAAAVYLDTVRAMFPDAPSPAPGERCWRGRYTTDRLPLELGIVAQRSFEDAMDDIAAAWAEGDPGGR